MSEYVTYEKCAEYRSEIADDQHRQDMDIQLNTKHRISFEKVYWICVAAIVGGFATVIGMLIKLINTI